MGQETESQLPVKFVRPQIIPIIPRNYEEIYKMGEMLAKTDMVPKDYKGKPANTIVAIQMGLEIGLMPIQAVQNIAVINGRPSLWGDALLALCQASGLLEWIEETIEDDFAVCEVKRRGDIKIGRQKYTVADAKRANLWGKAGSWTTNPKRMLQMRARGFGLRDKFADILKGIQSAEEQRDFIDVEPIIVTEVKEEKKIEETRKVLDDQKPNLELLKDAAKSPSDDIPVDSVPPETTKALISTDQFTVFLDKVRELKISNKKLVEFAKNNGFDDASQITTDKYDGMLEGLEHLTK